MVSGAYVLIADRNEESRTQAAACFERAGFEVREAATAQETLIAAYERRPALLILETHLPDISGYEVFRNLRDSFGDEFPVVFISGDRTDPYDRVAGLLLGADDYMTKPVAPDELLARARRLLPDSRTRSNGKTNGSTRGLTPRELQVLSLLAEGNSQKDIAGQLVISPKTVATHIEHVLGKLGVHSRTEAVALAYRNGLVSPPSTAM